MRIRAVAGMTVAILAALIWLALAVQPVAVLACASPSDVSPMTLPPEAVPPRSNDFRPSLMVDGVLAPGALGLPGEQITWIVTLRNVGTAPGTDIILTDQVHEQLRIDRVEVSRGEFAISEQVVVARTPFLAPGEEVQMRVDTTVSEIPSGGSVASRVRLSAQGPGGAIEDAALAEVFVPTGLPATGYPPAESSPAQTGLSVITVALLGMVAVMLMATYVWWRGSVRRI